MIDWTVVRYIVGAAVCVFLGMLIRGDATKGSASRAPEPPSLEKLGDWLAWLGMLTGCMFWGYYWWDMLRPADTASQLYAKIILVFCLGVAHPLGLPFLISRAFPYDPVNVELQSQVEHTAASKIQLYTTVGMAVASGIMVFYWVRNRLGIPDTVNQLFMAAVMVVFSILLPAFGMLRTVPKYWRQLLDMADEVERRRRELISEQIKAEAVLQQALIVISMPVMQSALEQEKYNREKLVRAVGGVIIRINESSRTIAKLLGMMIRNQNIRLPMVHDEEIYSNLREAFAIQEDLGSLRIGEERQSHPMLPSDISLEFQSFVNGDMTRQTRLPRSKQ